MRQGGTEMKLKDGFLLRNMAGSNVVIPIGQRAVDMNGMITLNETGAFIWKQLEQGKNEDEIVAAILETYDVEESHARACVATFLRKLAEVGCLA